uniref:NADH dehydrogenase [ubiquinone] 1 alpha subcomplex subunit 4 n=1 Tax=Anas zonorhyncha TaxID=75864 RepID=A0A8B9V8G3_9AVES
PALPLMGTARRRPCLPSQGVGLGSAVLYLLRLALYSPDVSWDRKNNPEPWNKLGPTDQYKVSTGVNWGGPGSLGRGHGHLSGTSTTLCLGKRGEQHQPWDGGRGAQALECPHPCSYPSPFQFMAVSTDYKSLKKDRPSF